MITREVQDGSCGKVCMVFGLWSLVYGLWSMVYGLWSMVYGLWSVTSTVKNIINSMTSGNSTTFHNPGENRQNISHQCSMKDVSMLDFMNIITRH